MTRKFRGDASPSLLGALAIAASLVVAAPPMRAQESAPPESNVAATAPDTLYAPIPIPMIPEAMSAAVDFTLHREDTLGYRVPVNAFTQQARAFLEELRVRGPMTDSLLARQISVRGIEMLYDEWAGRRSNAERLIRDGRVLGRLLFVRSYTLDSLEHVFDLTLKVHGERLSVTRLQGIDTLRARIAMRQNLEAELGARVDSLLLVLLGAEREVSRIQDDIKSAESELRGRLLSRDAPPLWALLAARGESPASDFRQGAAENWAAIRQYVTRHSSWWALLALAFVALVVLMVVSRKRILEWVDTASIPKAVSHVLSRPASAALLFVVLLVVYLFPAFPVPLRDALGVLVVLPFLRVAAGLVSPPYVKPIGILAGLFLIDKLVGIVGEQALVWRLSLLLRSTVGCLVMLHVASRVQRGMGALAAGRTLWLWLAWMSAGLLALATVGNLFGFAALAIILTEGVLNSAFIGLVLVVLHPIINGTVLLLLHSPMLRGSRYLARVGSKLIKNTNRLTKLLLTVTWIWTVLNLFRAGRPVLERLTVLFTARLELGAASLSLGGVLAFIAVAWVGVSLSRIISAVLEEDILDRMSMPRGVPAAVGRVTQIALLALVFVLAAATAGVQLSQLALLTGALGVGIGFGMQNVVNNFMSGLILMFERPIQLGDIVEVGPVVGTVQKIGFRSSTIKTFEGSSVIVPNGNLISREVINWTHLDQSRRIDLPVGVAYGTDPERVIELLVRTAAAHPEVSKEPAPVALFQQFGDSSLNFVLRYWTQNFPRWTFIASEVTVEVNKALADAGIEIPFPQRTLHVASWNPEARPPVSAAPGAARASSQEPRNPPPAP